ncbi:MAG: protein kinase [Deltaproteobacteria bacterium]|nr:protein kinase [Deltaproteobacteria bacterium]
MKAGAARNSLVGSRIGRFEVIAEIGTGGMASVYVARSTGSGGFRRLVAIKVMHAHLSSDESFVDMFLDEARVAATIHHPNVVPIIDVGFEDGLVFLIMDYIEGDSFSNVEKVAISLRRRIPLGITLRVVLDALAGLHAAHELCDLEGNHLKIIHRDVSPQNIVVGVDGVSRIVDFGIAKAESRVTTTKVGMIKGKLNFMAPEQLRSAPLDRRVDVFGMGVTLWEAVTLRRLYAGENDFDTARRILTGEYPPLLDFDARLPPVLDEICKKALNPDPDQRFMSADEFADAIETHLGGSVASGRDVAAFISGVASQKLERERRAMRESANSDMEMDPLSSTVIEPARHAMTDPGVPSSILPSTSAPRVRQEESGPRPSSKLRQPTMAMPAPADSSARTSNVRERTPTVKAAPLRPSRPSRPAAPPAADDYEDDGETALFSHGSPVMAQIRGRRSPPPAAEHEAQQGARKSPEPAQSYDPYRDATAQAKATTRDVGAPPNGYNEAPQQQQQGQQQFHGRQEEAATLQDHPSQGQAAPTPMAPMADPFPMAPQPTYGGMNPQATMPPGWTPGAAPLAPPPPQKSSSGALLLLASLGFLVLASGALWYVLHATR